MEQLPSNQQLNNIQLNIQAVNHISTHILVVQLSCGM